MLLVLLLLKVPIRDWSVSREAVEFYLLPFVIDPHKTLMKPYVRRNLGSCSSIGRVLLSVLLKFGSKKIGCIPH